MALRILGDYNIIKQLGIGSLGSVYLAEHRFMKKQFALKVLPDELSQDRGFIQRFEDEVKVLSELNHPNIVKIHNISFAQGSYFLVTDCIVDSIGEPLNLFQYIREQKKLTEDDILNCLRQLANALDHAHKKTRGDQFLVHRGIKLNNILVSKSRDHVHFYLSDFGLSKIIGPGAVLSRTYKILSDALGVVPVVESKDTNHEKYSTQLGDEKKLSVLHASFLQGFSFLAPEQKRIEDKHKITPETDRYAFGVLAYYLLTGTYPEGIFEMPSAVDPSLKYNWDKLIQNCLCYATSKRVFQLNELLTFIAFKDESVESIEKTIEKVTINTAEIEEKVPVCSMNYLQEAVKEKLEEKSVAERIQERIRSEHTVTHYRPEINEIRAIDPLLTDVAIITAGDYLRGSVAGNRDEMPRHYIKLKHFAMDIHPVTNEQFTRFLEFLGDEKDSQNHDIIRLRESRIRRAAGKLTIESGYAKHPVIGVTWYGALAYAKWVGKRLPTEAEWEVAAKGGVEEAIYPTGDDIEKSQANFFSSDTTAVMSYAPNEYGLYDMAGNVYEWCQDWYEYNYYEISAQEPIDPKGPLQGVYRVLRGGCWKSLKEDLRSSHRHRNNPGVVNRTYGFRCAADI
jgi:formylglycine-generating enzyme required for sulfatase activity